jgi:hypothetical protein
VRDIGESQTEDLVKAVLYSLGQEAVARDSSRMEMEAHQHLGPREEGIIMEDRKEGAVGDRAAWKAGAANGLGRRK